MEVSYEIDPMDDLLQLMEAHDIQEVEDDSDTEMSVDTSQSQMSSCPRPGISFLAFPPEIRNMIYRKYAETRNTILNYDQLTGSISDWFSPTILQLNHQIRWEASPFMYSGKIQINACELPSPICNISKPRLPIYSKYRDCDIFLCWDNLKYNEPQHIGDDFLRQHNKTKHALSEELSKFSSLRKVDFCLVDVPLYRENGILQCKNGFFQVPEGIWKYVALRLNLMCFARLEDLMEVVIQLPNDRVSFSKDSTKDSPKAVSKDQKKIEYLVESVESARTDYKARFEHYRRENIGVCKCVKKEIVEINMSGRITIEHLAIWFRPFVKVFNNATGVYV